MTKPITLILVWVTFMPYMVFVVTGDVCIVSSGHNKCIHACIVLCMYKAALVFTLL